MQAVSKVRSSGQQREKKGPTLSNTKSIYPRKKSARKKTGQRKKMLHASITPLLIAVCQAG
jgi:hypothetical protein